MKGKKVEIIKEDELWEDKSGYIYCEPIKVSSEVNLLMQILGNLPLFLHGKRTNMQDQSKRVQEKGGNNFQIP